MTNLSRIASGAEEQDLETILPRLASTLRVIAGAMCAALFVFASTIVFLFLSQPHGPASEKALRTIRLLSSVNALMIVVAYPLSARLSRISLKAGGSRAALLQTAEIVRLVPREAAGLFGLVACFLAAQNGVLNAHPAYWLNALGAGLFWCSTALSFPNEERLRAALRESS